jgi:hypothetical protein
MDLKPTKPKPVCGGGPCGAVHKDPQRLDEITCPCGYGYYDKLRHVFVPGSLVKEGQAISREEYEAHVRRCPDQEKGAPVLGVAFIGADSEEPRAVVYLGATGGSSQPQRTANPYLSGWHGSTTADARNREGFRPMGLEPREQKTASRAQGVFLPEQRVEKEVLQFYLQLLHAESANFFEARKGVGRTCCMLYLSTHACLPDARGKAWVDGHGK